MTKEFWDFSFYEMGYYDIPKLVETVKLETNVKKITYIGHS